MKPIWHIRDYLLTAPIGAFGEFDDFFQLWLTKHEAAQAEGRKLPAWKDFDLMELRPWWGRMSLVEHTEDTNRYFFRLWGTELTDWYGVDLTRKFLDEVYGLSPERQETGTNHINFFFQGAVIAYWKDVLTHVNRDHAFMEGFSVPLSRDGKTTTHMLTTKNRKNIEDTFWPSVPHVAEYISRA